MSRPRFSVRAITAGLVAVLLIPQGAAYAGVRLPDPAPGTPITDPIPQDPVDAHTALTISEVATFPKSEPVPTPTDARLKRQARINYVGELPDHSGRLFVPDLNGKLYLLKNGTPKEYLDFGALYAPDFFSGRGLGTGFGFVTFHPDFRHNGRFYTVHSEAGAALTDKKPDFAQKAPFVHSVVTEWTANDPAADTFSGTHREILRISFDSQIHGIQQIDFNPTAGRHDEDYGLLYLAVGDGGIGYVNDDPQNLAIPHGKILRIDPRGHNSANGRYGIPRTNPFVRRPGALGEIYALGMRDPHRFSWDSQATWDWSGGWPRLRHRMFLGHIGEHDIEAVYDVKAGDNFGWSEREGPFVFNKADRCNLYPLPADDKKYGYTYPVAAYDHNAPPDWPCTRDVGRAISGGFVYRGHKIPSLRGKYVFADLVDGRLFYTNAAEMRRGGKLATIYELKVENSAGWPVKMSDIVGDARVDLRLGTDNDGELYLLAKSNGKVWKVTGVHRTPRLPDVIPSLQRNLVAYYDFEHPAVHNPAQEQDQGRGGTTINLINGGAPMRVLDGANPSSAHSIQLKQVDPTKSGGNDDWKAG